MWKWAALALLLSTTPAMAQECRSGVMGDYSSAEVTLRERYGERIIAVRMFDDGSMQQLWVNDRTGTWTVLAVTPDLLGYCMAASGGGFTSGTGIPDGFVRIAARGIPA